jgi:hypothetical protein
MPESITAILMPSPARLCPPIAGLAHSLSAPICGMLENMLGA